MEKKYKINDADHVSIVQGEDKDLVIRVMDEFYNPVDMTNADVTLRLPRAEGYGAIKRSNVNNTFLAAHVNIEDDEITIEDHGYVDGDLVQISGTGLPTGISALTDYEVDVIDRDVIQLLDSDNGAIVDLSTQGTGPFTVVFQPLELEPDSILGRCEVGLDDVVTSALLAGEKMTIELEYTIDEVTTIVQMKKALSVSAQEV